MIYFGVFLLGLFLMFILILLGFWAEPEFNPYTLTGTALQFMGFIFWFIGLTGCLFLIGGGAIGFIAPLFGVQL